MERKITDELLPHLFRTEYGKLVAVIAKVFGFHHLQVAEDIASETFLQATESWPYHGVPANPVAWIYAVAKNKAKNHLARIQVFDEKIAPTIKANNTANVDVEFDLTDHSIRDSQLRMLFAVCHPAISEAEQICLALRTLCGFGLTEIADAFLTNKHRIHKRLQRARQKLRSEDITFVVPDGPLLEKRLPTVLRMLYLLFNEGYYSESHSEIIRHEWCVEAMNLTYLLLNYKPTNTHSSNALMALFCFHASRLEARQAPDGTVILYADQDTSRWDTELIEKGFHYLKQASTCKTTSKYYIEASIAYWHTTKSDSNIKWPAILALYDTLVIQDSTPIVALNRIFALYKVKGSETALREIETVPVNESRFYWLLLAELHKKRHPEKAKKYLQVAMTMAANKPERRAIQQRLDDLQSE